MAQILDSWELQRVTDVVGSTGTPLTNQMNFRYGRLADVETCSHVQLQKWSDFNLYFPFIFKFQIMWGPMKPAIFINQNPMKCIIFWLVVYFVSLDDDIPNMMGKS